MWLRPDTDACSRWPLYTWSSPHPRIATGFWMPGKDCEPDQFLARPVAGGWAVTLLDGGSCPVFTLQTHVDHCPPPP
jgi:hypothetical protein